MEVKWICPWQQYLCHSQPDCHCFLLPAYMPQLNIRTRTVQFCMQDVTFCLNGLMVPNMASFIQLVSTSQLSPALPGKSKEWLVGCYHPPQGPVHHGFVQVKALGGPSHLHHYHGSGRCSDYTAQPGQSRGPRSSSQYHCPCPSSHPGHQPCHLGRLRAQMQLKTVSL